MLKIYATEEERLSKYLFSYSYVPINFNGLLIGTSIISNFDTSAIKAAKVYNLSLLGSNISEEGILIDKIFESRKLKLIIFPIFPPFTSTYGPRSQMSPREYWRALGSIQIAHLYRNKFKIEHHHLFEACDNELGVFRMPTVMVTNEKDRQNMCRFQGINPKSVSEYRALISSSRAHGARVLAFIPPINF